jgi:hypothetical protein
MREGRAGERANEQAHSLSLANACNPYYKHTPLVRDNTSRVSPLCSISRQPIWAGARNDKFTRRSRDPRVRNADRIKTPSIHMDWGRTEQALRFTINSHDSTTTIFQSTLLQNQVAPSFYNGSWLNIIKGGTPASGHDIDCTSAVISFGTITSSLFASTRASRTTLSMLCQKWLSVFCSRSQGP